MLAFDYPITRPYPWRWMTQIVCLVTCIILICLGLFNFAAVGYNRETSYHTVFESSSGLGWKNKLNPGYAEARSVNCDPSSLVVGGIYRTNNAIFALTADSLRDPITSAPLGSANYSGDTLDSCRVNRIYMVAEFATHDVKWRAKVACKTPQLFANFTVESTVTFRSGVPNGIVNTDTLGDIENEQNRPEAIVTSVLFALGLDVLAAVFFRPPPVPSTTTTTNTSASAMWAEWDPLAPDGSLPVLVSGIAAPDGTYLLGSGTSALSGLLPPSRRAMLNYAIALHDAILVDVGSTVYLIDRPDNNIFTNTTTLQTRIQTYDLLKLYMTMTNGSANGLNFSVPAAPFLLSHTSDFGLPIAARTLHDQSNAARLVQTYLCHSMVLKPLVTLVVDVFVATFSIFTAVWGMVRVVLMDLARKYSERGNRCTCETCNNGLMTSAPKESGILGETLPPGGASSQISNSSHNAP